MSQIHELKLEGCTPEPLMNYLKALGILRLVSEQKDPEARGRWENDVFVLQSSLNREELQKFFLEEYMPTPVVSPWNGDGGFLNKSAAGFELIKSIKKSNSPRLSLFKETIFAIEKISVFEELTENRLIVRQLESKKNNNSITEDEKEKLKDIKGRNKILKESIVYKLRNELPAKSLQWFDVCMALNSDGFITAPILGSGGCDGRMEFSVNFLANIKKVLKASDSTSDSTEWLKKSIFNIGYASTISSPIGQFYPGGVGGPNATQGIERGSSINPWDYVLMIEGLVLLAGSVTRKLMANRETKAAFPFTVNYSIAGTGVSSINEAKKSRGEIWLPLWVKLVNLAEITQIISEGRAGLGTRNCKNSVDIVRSIASFGVDRGINSFVRYGFLQRSGKAYLASNLGCFNVGYKEEVNLLSEIDAWLNMLRSKTLSDNAGKKNRSIPQITLNMLRSKTLSDNVPSRFLSAFYRIENTIYDFCKHGGKARFADILCALGKAEKELANGESFRSKKGLRPLGGLSPDWLQAANEGSVEFELALSLAGIYDAENKIGSLRTNLEPISWKPWLKWAEKERSVVWNAADLSTNLSAVLARRIMDGSRAGDTNLPFAFKKSALLESVSAFLYNRVNEQKLIDFLWGFMLIDNFKSWSNLRFNRRELLPLPRAYAILKLLFLPAALVFKNNRVYLAGKGEDGVIIRPEPRIVPLLKTGRLNEACEIAVRRLRVSGLAPIYRPQVKDFDFDTKRLAASLLFPISSDDVNRLVDMVCNKEKLAVNATI